MLILIITYTFFYYINFVLGDVAKNWFSDSFQSCECNSDCTDCKKHVNTKRKKLKNRPKRARISVHPRESIKNKKVSKQTARICPKSMLNDHLELVKFLWTIVEICIVTFLVIIYFFPFIFVLYNFITYMI